MSRNALGRGLSALLSDDSPVPQPRAKSPESPTRIPVNRVRPNRYQPRQNIDPSSIQELADSIKTHGLLQPIIVSFDSDTEEYELIAGERRLEASKHVGLETVPAIVQDVDDEARLELGLIENIQREDLNPIEEAQAYQLLMEKFSLTQDQVAERLGKNRATIANTLRLLKLPEDVQAEIATGSLSAGHAKALAAIEDEQELRQALRRLREGAYTVRQTEQWVRGLREKSKGEKKRRSGVSSKTTDPQLLLLEDSLQDLFGTKVRIHSKSGDQGRIEIEFYSQDDLGRIVEILGLEVE